MSRGGLISFCQLECAECRSYRRRIDRAKGYLEDEKVNRESAIRCAIDLLEDLRGFVDDIDDFFNELANDAAINGLREVEERKEERR